VRVRPSNPGDFALSAVGTSTFCSLGSYPSSGPLEPDLGRDAEQDAVAIVAVEESGQSDQ
jgi:hypothetical protein